jgi:FkbM family methyltransferase
MQSNLRPQTQIDRLRAYFTVLGFALKRGNSLPSITSLYYLAKIKPGLVYRGLAKFAPDTIYRVSFRAGSGKILDIHVRDNGQDAPMLLEFFNNDRLAEIERLKWKPQVIYDLGANIGISSLSLAALCPKACIYGFEPVPANFKICSMNYSNLTNAQAFNCAIGSSSGTMSFKITDDPRGGHLTANAAGDPLDSDKRIKMAVWTIADLIDIKGLAPPDFLKVDVEGAELDVLNGLGLYAKSIKQIHIETHSAELRGKCIRWLELNGFGIEEEFRYTADLGALWARNEKLLSH